MPQCKKCKLFMSTTKDDLVKCKGTCDGVFHKKCARPPAMENEVCEECLRRPGSPKDPPNNIAPATSSESVLEELNKKLEIIYGMQKSLNGLIETVEMYAEKYQELTDFKEKAEKKIAALEQKTAHLEKYNMALEERVSRLETNNLEKNVVISGLEKKEGEDINKLLGDIAQKLNISSQSIVEARRVGSVSENNKPQRVVVTLATKSARDLWLKQRKRRITNADIYDNENMDAVYINEDLTKATRYLLWRARTELKPAYTYVWVDEGRILARKNESEKKVHNIRAESDIYTLKSDLE